MSEPVETVVETSRPSFNVRMVDGRVDFLQFPRVDEQRLDEFLRDCREVLGRALRQHASDRVEAVMARYGPTSNPHRDRVMAHVAERLEAAAGRGPRPQRRWFPEQADGRDPSGEVHVSVTATGVEVLEAPFAALEHPGRGALAIVDATNLALERLEGDIADHVRRHAPDERPPEPDWEALAALADRLARGYF